MIPAINFQKRIFMNNNKHSEKIISELREAISNAKTKVARTDNKIKNTSEELNLLTDKLHYRTRLENKLLRQKSSLNHITRILRESFHIPLKHILEIHSEAKKIKAFIKSLKENEDYPQNSYLVLIENYSKVQKIIKHVASCYDVHEVDLQKTVHLIIGIEEIKYKLSNLPKAGELKTAIDSHRKYLLDYRLKNDSENIYIQTLNEQVSLIKSINDSKLTNKQINEINEDGDTPLIKAIDLNNVSLAKFLIEMGANVNIADSEGRTPLMIAAESGDCISTKLLLENKAEIELKNNNGDTALDLATQEEHEEIVDLIEDKIQIRRVIEKNRRREVNQISKHNFDVLQNPRPTTERARTSSSLNENKITHIDRLSQKNPPKRDPDLP